MPVTIQHHSPAGGYFHVPPRPGFPNQEDNDRAEWQMLRMRMLTHKFDEDAAQFFEEAYGVDNARMMGIPDTSLAPLPAQTAQLTTPGLYQKTPSMRWRNSRGGEAVKRVIDEQDGILAQAMYWSMMRMVMYFTVGVGNQILAVTTVDRNGRTVPVVQPAPVFDVAVECPEDDPMTPYRLMWRRLRVRESRDGKTRQADWFWDVYDISDPENPTFRVMTSDLREDVTRVHVPGYEGYGWVTPEGTPYLPFVFYHAAITGTFWHEYRPALRQGTLRSVANWTMTGQAALWSQGNHNLVGGVDPAAIPTTEVMVDPDYSKVAPLKTMRCTPGMVTFVPVEDEKQLQLLPMTSGVDLAKMVDFSNTYSINLAITDGISPSDATRRSANPTSGAALTISQADKRAFAASVTPAFAASDLQAARVLAWTMTAETGVYHEAEGYTIRYAPIPLTPTEQKELRDQLTWEQQQGQRSMVDVHMALNPGVSREQALDAIVQAAVDEARIQRAVEEALEAEGLKTPPQPPAPEPEVAPAAEVDEDDQNAPNGEEE